MINGNKPYIFLCVYFFHQDISSSLLNICLQQFTNPDLNMRNLIRWNLSTIHSHSRQTSRILRPMPPITMKKGPARNVRSRRLVLLTRPFVEALHFAPVLDHHFLLHLSIRPDSTSFMILGIKDIFVTIYVFFRVFFMLYIIEDPNNSHGNKFSRA